MANAARSIRPHAGAQHSAQRAIRGAPVSNLPVPQPAERPAGAIHPSAVGAALVVAIWFVIAMAISFSGNGETDYLMAVVIAFSVIFFTLTVGIASHSARVSGPDEQSTFRQFLAREVSIYTGVVSGREALVQLLALPVTLAIGGMAIGFIFILGI